MLLNILQVSGHPAAKVALVARSPDLRYSLQSPCCFFKASPLGREQCLTQKYECWDSWWERHNINEYDCPSWS